MTKIDTELVLSFSVRKHEISCEHSKGTLNKGGNLKNTGDKQIFNVNPGHKNNQPIKQHVIKVQCIKHETNFSFFHGKTRRTCK